MKPPNAELWGIDYYGNEWGPLDPKRPKTSLLNMLHARTAVPMYRDKTNGSSQHVGYVVDAANWVELYWRTPWEGRA